MDQRHCDNCKVRSAERYEPVWDEWWCFTCARGQYAVQFPVICAWCGVETGYGPVEHSHSMCAACLEQRYPREVDDAA